MFKRILVFGAVVAAVILLFTYVIIPAFLPWSNITITENGFSHDVSSTSDFSLKNNTKHEVMMCIMEEENTCRDAPTWTGDGKNLSKYFKLAPGREVEMSFSQCEELHFPINETIAIVSGGKFTKKLQVSLNCADPNAK
jgi:hypothetical protein